MGKDGRMCRQFTRHIRLPRCPLKLPSPLLHDSDSRFETPPCRVEALQILPKWWIARWTHGRLARMQV